VGGSARARQRIPVAPLRVRFLAEGLDAIGELTEISRTGVFVQAEESPRPGAVVALQFWTPAGELVDLRGEVRWNTEGLANADGLCGFGVLMHEPSLKYREFFLWAQAEKEEDLEPEEL
jgi:hypothetical protein